MKKLTQEQINEIERFLHTGNYQCVNRGHGFKVPNGFAYPYVGRPEGRLAVVTKERGNTVSLFEVYGTPLAD